MKYNKLIIFSLFISLSTYAQTRDTFICKCKLVAIDTTLIDLDNILYFKHGNHIYKVLSRKGRLINSDSSIKFKKLVVQKKYDIKLFPVNYVMRSENALFANIGEGYWIDGVKVLQKGEYFYETHDLLDLYIKN